MMLKSLSANNRTAFDIINIVAGFGLFLSPWLLGFAGDAYAAWNAWIVGAAIALIAIAALYAFYEAEEWVNVMLGLWSVIAPWALGFSALAAAMWVNVAIGVLVAALAAYNIWLTHNHPLSTA